MAKNKEKKSDTMRMEINNMKLNMYMQMTNKMVNALISIKMEIKKLNFIC